MRVTQRRKVAISTYRRLVQEVYRNDPYYRASQHSLVDMLWDPASAFARQASVEPVFVESDGKVVAGGAFVHTPKMPGILQLAFLEFLKSAENAVAILTEGAKVRAKQLGLQTVVVGLNGHVNYGLGIREGSARECPCFGSSYNPNYYVPALRPLASREHKLLSYELALPKPDEARMPAGLAVRPARFRAFREDVALYTELNNRIFEGHPYYWPRTAAEDLELFLPFKPFITPSCLAFLECEGKAVGFALWYPDFNEIIPRHGSMNLSTWIRYRLGRKQIRRARFAEIGVLPEFRKHGASFALVAACAKAAAGRHECVESGWVSSENLKSRLFCNRWNARQVHSFSVFDMDV